MRDTVVEILGIIGATVLLLFLGALAVMLLWNWLMPMLFGIQTLSYWQAVGLSLLCGCLFNGGTSLSGRR